MHCKSVQMHASRHGPSALALSEVLSMGEFDWIGRMGGGVHKGRMHHSLLHGCTTARCRRMAATLCGHALRMKCGPLAQVLHCA